MIGEISEYKGYVINFLISLLSLRVSVAVIWVVELKFLPFFFGESIEISPNSANL